MGRKTKNIVILSFLLTALVLMSVGAKRNEFKDILSNATLICYSCIGLK